jgi:hypothetical protein
VPTLLDAHMKKTDVSDSYGFKARKLSQVAQKPIVEAKNVKASKEKEKPPPPFIKIMDTILLENLQPQKWIYTDLLGRIQHKSIDNIKIDEVVKAFLLNSSKDLALENGEFKNEDLLHLFDTGVDASQNICFLLNKNIREFMNIQSLCDIKRNPLNIEAL